MTRLSTKSRVAKLEAGTNRSDVRVYRFEIGDPRFLDDDFLPEPEPTHARDGRPIRWVTQDGKPFDPSKITSDEPLDEATI
jgi:hypothetical protein